MVAAKVISLLVPLQFKRAVDALSLGVLGGGRQRVGRRITAWAFTDILGQDAAFHAAAAAGALTRVVDRDTRSVLTILQGLLFSFGPAVLELLLVCGVL